MYCTTRNQCNQWHTPSVEGQKRPIFQNVSLRAGTRSNATGERGTGQYAGHPDVGVRRSLGSPFFFFPASPPLPRGVPSGWRRWPVGLVGNRCRLPANRCLSTANRRRLRPVQHLTTVAVLCSVLLFNPLAPDFVGVVAFVSVHAFRTRDLSSAPTRGRVGRIGRAARSPARPYGTPPAPYALHPPPPPTSPYEPPRTGLDQQKQAMAHTRHGTRRRSCYMVTNPPSLGIPVA